MAAITDSLLRDAATVTRTDEERAIRSCCSNNKKSRLGKRQMLISSSLFLALIGLTLVSQSGVFTEQHRPSLDLRLNEQQDYSVEGIFATNWGNASCYKYTSGTCSLLPCDASRNAQCLFGSCVCPEGFCTSASGECVHETNKMEAFNFTLRNVNWPNYYLEHPRKWVSWGHTQLMVTSDQSSASRFNMYASTSPLHPSKRPFYLQPVEFPEYAVHASSPSAFGRKAEIVSLTRESPYDPFDLLNYACRPSGYPHALRIDMAGGSNCSMYARQYLQIWAPWHVFCWGNAVGEEAYWIPEPQINVSFRDCE